MILLLSILNSLIFYYFYPKILKIIPIMGESAVAYRLILIYLSAPLLSILIYQVIIRRLTKFRVTRFDSLVMMFFSAFLIYCYLVYKNTYSIIGSTFLGICIVFIFIIMSLVLFNESMR